MAMVIGLVYAKQNGWMAVVTMMSGVIPR